MQQTLEPTLEVVAQATDKIRSAQQRMLHLLSFVPDDKLTYSPSPTSKSCLRIVAHCALSSKAFGQIIAGTLPDELPVPEQFFRELNAAEAAVSTREQAVAVLEESTEELCRILANLNSESLNSSPASPFGPMPMQFWVCTSADHLAGHTRQVEYLQTTWGDLDNHFA